MPGIFICYRREDGGYAGRLADRLKEHFGANKVFRDVDAIEPGADFVDSIDKAVGSSAVLLAVIAPRWLILADKSGQRRIEDPHDYVAQEISSALTQKLAIIPVLVGGAAMPTVEELPANLTGLGRRQAQELTDTRWDFDVSQLISAIEKIIAKITAVTTERPDPPVPPIQAPASAPTNQRDEGGRFLGFVHRFRNLIFAVLIAGGIATIVYQFLPRAHNLANRTQDQSGQSSDNAIPVSTIDQSTVGTVIGHVRFDGIAPKPAPIDMSADPACHGQNTSETVVVDDGNLANVFVYVKEGLGNYKFTPPSDSVKIDQRSCRYYPHVLGMLAGQPLEIINSDPTTHNFHPMPKDNREWNVSQPPAAPPIENRFSRPEIMIPVKNNEHPWMRMYINVVESPFFAVTDKSGRFEIKGLPAGTYTLSAIQEKLGDREQRIIVRAGDTTSVDFTFAP
jgi:hypothetical protein